MGLDVGERRVGVAIGDELGMISSPLTTVQRREGDLAELRDLAMAKGVDRLVDWAADRTIRARGSAGRGRAPVRGGAWGRG